jgi:hypothetical protein
MRHRFSDSCGGVRQSAHGDTDGGEWMFEKANKIVPWIIATGIWANFTLAVYTGDQARAINIEFTKALESVTSIKSDVKTLEMDVASFRYLTCIKYRICAR